MQIKDHNSKWVYPGARHGATLFVIIICLIFFPKNIFSQGLSGLAAENQYRTVHWDAKDGLSLGYKNAMIKDINGFLWIASPAGLNRFDGNTFKVYYAGENEYGSILGSYCFSLIEDSLHHIWIGTNKGLVRYNTKVDTFQSIKPVVKAYADITTIIPISATRNLVYCIEYASQITSYDIRSMQRKVHAVLPPGQKWKNGVVMAASFFDSASNSIWMLDGDPEEAGGGLTQVSLTDGNINNFAWDCFDKKNGHVHFTQGMCYDKKRNAVWLNSPDGLLMFDLKSKFFSRPVSNEKGISSETHFGQIGIAIDSAGNIWFANRPSGILRYDPEKQNIQPLNLDIEQQERIAAGLMRIYFDKEGMVWMGYVVKKGMYQLIPITPAVKQYGARFKHIDHPIPGRIQNFSHGENGKIWIGSMQGIYSYDPVTEVFDDWEYENRDADEKEKIFPLGINKKAQKAWLYNWDERRMFELDLKTKKRRNIFLNSDGNMLENFDVSAHYARPLLNGLILQVDMNGIYFIQGGSQYAELITSIPHHVTNVAVANDQYVFVRLHFTAHNLCFSLIDGKWQQVKTPIDSLEWSCITYDDLSKTYWVGGVRVLYHFDEEFRLIKEYTAADGIPELGFLSILTDQYGKVWFNNSEGKISCLDPKTGTVSYLTEKDGYKGNVYFWQIPFIKDETGNLYFAGVNGIDRISPSALKNYPPPIIYIDKILVNGKRIFGGIGKEKTTQITLNHLQRKITLETGILDYYAEKDNSIRYKLEGINDSWQYAPVNHIIQYEELPPGKYRLVIQASRSGNLFQGPQKFIDIVIRPAYWETGWFMLLSIMVFVIIIYGIIRNRLHQRYKSRLEQWQKDNQLSEMRQNTAALEQQALALEMQALRAQMNPHFIFNSLNAINRFIMQNDKIQASEYLTKFSRLVRLILENSKESLISLESELESLSLYLELESLRFEERFQYKISVPHELLEAEVKVPPLIIQPFAENAIWHGLMHKPEKGQLDIEISAEKDQLYIRIADDGIGREKSRQIESKSAILHKSMGQQITMDRIAALGSHDAAKSSVSVNDLVNTDGIGAGTEVIIQIPLMYD
jgi:hypothetical protein